MTDETEDDRKALLRKAYGTASQRLRENHREEFNDLRSTAAKELGVEWAPRLTAEEKAEAEFDALLDAHPHLRERLQGTT